MCPINFKLSIWYSDSVCSSRVFTLLFRQPFTLYSMAEICFYIQKRLFCSKTKGQPRNFCALFPACGFFRCKNSPSPINYWKIFENFYLIPEDLLLHYLSYTNFDNQRINWTLVGFGLV